VGVQVTKTADNKHIKRAKYIAIKILQYPLKMAAIRPSRLSQHTVPAERAKQDKQMTRNMGIKILASS
jgi:hypothetical protein